MLRGEPKLVRLFAGLRKPRRPAILGSDFAGVVESVGPGVTRFKPGDEVYAEVDAGGFAELVAVSEKHLARKPANLSFEEAAAVPMGALTALQGLREAAKLQPGQHVLVNGASGGVGSFAVQMARALGAAEVTAVCSARNLELVRSAGADHAIDYEEEDVTRGVARFDVVIDTVGTHSFGEFTRVMRPGGIYVAIGRLDDRYIGPMIAGKLRALFTKHGFRSFLAKRNAEDLEYIATLIEDGKIKPIIDRRYTMAEVPEAIRYLETGHVRGKLVVTA